MNARTTTAAMLGGVLMLAIASSGCASAAGSVASIARSGRPLPYVGTRLDAGVATSQEPTASSLPIRVLAAIDLPLSFAADTASLPVTLPWWAIHRHGRAQDVQALEVPAVARARDRASE